MGYDQLKRSSQWGMKSENRSRCRCNALTTELWSLAGSRMWANFAGYSQTFITFRRNVIVMQRRNVFLEYCYCNSKPADAITGTRREEMKSSKVVSLLVGWKGSARFFEQTSLPSKAIREFKITTTATATGTSLNKRFKVTEHSFSARFCWCKLALAQGFQKTNMPSTERSFYLLKTCTICVMFLYNCM